MLIPTYYLLSKIWDIFATRRRILLEINKNYFRRGEVKQKYFYHDKGHGNLPVAFFYYDYKYNYSSNLFSPRRV